MKELSVAFQRAFPTSFHILNASVLCHGADTEERRIRYRDKDEMPLMYDPNFARHYADTIKWIQFTPFKIPQVNQQQ